MKKPYVVEVEETYRRTVVIYAEDPDDAYERAEELCNNDDIEITVHHFSSRNCVCTGEANDADLRGYPKFDKTGEITEPPEDAEAALLQKARDIIRSFIRSEYGDECDEADFSNESLIPVAWTDYEDEGIKMQVFIDLPARKFKTYLNGYLVSSRGDDDLEEFIDDLDFALDWEDLVIITEEEREVFDACVSSGKRPDLKE